MAKKRARSVSKKRTRKSPGPSAETLTLEGNWKGNIKRALAKKRPKSGWPKE